MAAPWTKFQSQPSTDAQPWEKFKPKEREEKAAPDRQAKNAQRQQQIDEYFQENPDLLGSLAKGVAGGIAGLPGDIESLGRLGLGFLTDVSQENALPTSHDLIQKMRRDDREPFTSERYAEKIGSFAGPGGILGKLLKAPAAATLAGDIGAGIGSQTAEEMEAGPLGQIAGSLLGGVAGVGSLNAGLKASQGLKNVVKDVGKGQLGTGTAARSLSKTGPAVKEAVDIADKLNVHLPPSALTESGSARVIEKLINLNSKSKHNFDQILKNTNEDLIKSYGNILDKVGPKGKTAEEAGISVQSAIKNRQAVKNEEVRNLYREMEKQAKGLEVPAKDINRSLDSIEAKLSKIPKASEEEAKALKTVREIKNSLSEIEVKGNIPMEAVVDQIRSLNDIIDFEALGGAKRLLKVPQLAMRKSLEKYGKGKPQFIDAYKAAQGEAKYVAKTLRNDLVSSLLKKEQPELIMNQLSNPSGVRMVEKAVGDSRKGKEVLGELKRAKLGQIIDSLAVDQSGNFRIDAFTNVLKDPKKRELVSSLMGKEAYADLKDLQKLSSHLKQSSKYLANPSGSGDVALKGALLSQQIVSVVKGVYQFATNFDPSSLLTAAGLEVTPRAVARVYTNPKLIKEMRDLAKLNAKSSPRLMDHKASKVLRMVKEIENDKDSER